MGKAFDVLCVGLTVCDIIARPVGKSVLEQDSSRIDSLTFASGGDALNAAVNLAKLGQKVRLIGKVGRDMAGEYLIGEAARYGIDTGLMAWGDGLSTSTSIVLVEADGERHFAYYGKTNDALCVADIPDSAINDARIVHLGSAMALKGLDGAGSADLFKRAHAAGARTSMDVTWDSDGRWLGKIDEALHFTDVFMPSLDEARRISGCTLLEEMESFFARYGLEILVVKLGADGCYVTDFKERYNIPAFKVKDAVDTTGAGDAFVAGFLTGTVMDLPLQQRGELGCAVAAQCVTAVGATAGTRGLAETTEFIKNNTR